MTLVWGGAFCCISTPGDSSTDPEFRRLGRVRGVLQKEAEAGAGVWIACFGSKGDDGEDTVDAEERGAEDLSFRIRWLDMFVEYGFIFGLLIEAFNAFVEYLNSHHQHQCHPCSRR